MQHSNEKSGMIKRAVLMITSVVNMLIDCMRIMYNVSFYSTCSALLSLF